MPGMNNRVYMDAENAKKVFRAFNEVYVTGIPTKGFEWETIRKDGARVYMEVSVSLIARPGEKPTGFRGIARDITERKKAEEALRLSEENFRRSLEDSPLGVRIVSAEGETIYANRAILDVYDIEDLKTTPVKKLYTPESYAEYQIRRGKENEVIMSRPNTK
jgi:PAS domain-containing protein